MNDSPAITIENNIYVNKNYYSYDLSKTDPGLLAPDYTHVWQYKYAPDKTRPLGIAADSIKKNVWQKFI